MTEMPQALMTNLLTALIFLPVAGALLLIFLPKENHRLQKNVTFAVTLAEFLLSLPVAIWFDGSTAAMQFVQKIPWIPQFGISYHVGVDGISLWLLLLTTLLMPVTILSTYESIQKHVKEFMIFMLLLEVGMVGVFLALDLFLFYIFWELVLIPMYFLIGVWGSDRRIYSAIKFFLFTFAGSVLMLVAIIALYFHHYEVTGVYSTDLLAMYGLTIPVKLQFWMFAAFALAFAFKVPMFPFHTWLPDAHVDAPTAGSVILAAVLLKMGTYGFLRFAMPLFPVAAVDLAPIIGTLAVIGILYGALVAMVQKDIKKLVAYSSVAHLGFVMLGLFAFNVQGIEGGILRDPLRETAHPSDLGVRGAVQGASPVRRLLHDHHPLLDRAPRNERLRRRVPHPGGGVPTDEGADRGGGQRRHLRGGLHALDVPAGDVRHDHEREEPAPSGHERAGVGLHAASHRLRLLDRRISPDVPPEDGRVGYGPRGADRDEAAGGAFRLPRRGNARRPLLRR
jgi:NADH:ubiquinone oxidoreductase subunit 2 (subunit N)